MVYPIYVYKNPQYIKTIEDIICGDMVDHTYNLTVDMRDEYVNTIIDGVVSCCKILSFGIHLEDALKNWKENNHAIYFICCTFMNVRWIFIGIIDL